MSVNIGLNLFAFIDLYDAFVRCKSQEFGLLQRIALGIT